MTALHCPICNLVTPHDKASHHSGELMLNCAKCHDSWRPLTATRQAKAVLRKATARKVQKNPSPRSAKALATKFHGRTPDPSEVTRLTKPKIPNTLANIGKIFAIEYIAERDGKEYRFRHVFKAKARPHLAVSPDGKNAFMLGGAWVFTEDGFEDET